MIADPGNPASIDYVSMSNSNVLFVRSKACRWFYNYYGHDDQILGDCCQLVYIAVRGIVG